MEADIAVDLTVAKSTGKMTIQHSTFSGKSTVTLSAEAKLLKAKFCIASMVVDELNMDCDEIVADMHLPSYLKRFKPQVDEAC